jgi:beta-glucosidase
MSGVEGASVLAEGFTQWPDAPGFAAIGDPAVTRRFAATVAQEYRAVGITMALSPQADVATEPRWSRIKDATQRHATSIRRTNGIVIVLLANRALTFNSARTAPPAPASWPG